MREKEFNLLSEPWISVSFINGTTEELSLADVLLDAHNITSLSGELPTQDVAILRLLLGVLHAVFTRVDETGAPLESDYDPVDLWKRLWDLKKFPEDVIKDYLQKYEDRFWLFHPQRPFWQIAKLNKGTNYSASKLIGELSESSNKLRLFQSRNGTLKRSLPYAEAARWLINLNAYDDTSSKPSRDTEQKLPSPGAGWLGKLGMIFAEGDNFFETLMLNFVMCNDDGEKWEMGEATWEQNEPKISERTEIAMPYSQTTLLTLQSRRILLERSDDRVIGYRLLGGDFFQKENTFSEQMTIWREKDDIYTPKRHDISKQLWRGFASMFAEKDGIREPGIVKWIKQLEYDDLVLPSQIKLHATAVQYGDKDFFVTDVWDDTISIHSKLLSALGDAWINRIIKNIEITEKMVNILGFLASDITIAAGDKDGKGQRETTKEEAFFRLDIPFRNWLAGIDSRMITEDEGETMDAKCEAWINTSKDIIFDIGEELIAQAGTNAFTGRLSGEKNPEWMTAPKAYIKFKKSIYKMLNEMR